MIRKAIIMLLTLAAVVAVAVEVLAKAQPCPVRKPCPVRLYLGRSDQGSYRFVYAVSESWFSCVGYLRLWGEMDGRFDKEGEAWFHAICHYWVGGPGWRIPQVVRMDDVPPNHVFLRAVVVPRGFFFVTFAAYPMLVFVRGPLRRWRRRRRNLCIRCGYNLEGNVSGVCPECGETA